MCLEPRGGTCESAGRDGSTLSEAGGGAAGREAASLEESERSCVSLFINSKFVSSSQSLST